MVRKSTNFLVDKGTYKIHDSIFRYEIIAFLLRCRSAISMIQLETESTDFPLNALNRLMHLYKACVRIIGI